VRPTLSTARLALRPMTPDHTDLLVELHSDPEVMRHLTGRASTPAEVVEVWLPQSTDPHHDALGMGYWTAYEHEAFVGWFGLTPHGHGTAELGYRLRRAAWGRGLATEGARALVEHAFATLALERVLAETMAVNVGSRAVLDKIGMRHVRTEVREWDEPLPGSELGEVSYELTARQWRAIEGHSLGAG
jgi:RimJ/RimL family protein N-acetyltransferase